MRINRLLSLFLLSLIMLSTGISTNVLAKDETTEELDNIAEQYNRKIKDDKYKVVCRKETRVGTRFKKKVCRTIASMEREANEAKKMLSQKRTSVQ